MCPVCLTSIALTAAMTTGAGVSGATLLARARRAWITHHTDHGAPSADSTNEAKYDTNDQPGGSDGSIETNRLA